MASFMLSLLIPIIVLSIFSSLAKSGVWVSISSSIFECGFTSYFFSRFSFSSHYFIIGLIFLFLDLELCIIFPFFSGPSSDPSSMLLGWFFALILLIGLIEEWGVGALEWKFWASI